MLLVVTARCNLSCSYCFQNSKNSSKMQWDTLQAGVRIALGERTPVTHLMFSGGEPLLEFEHIRRAVEYAEASCPPGKRIRYWLSTNGILLTGDVADFLQEHDFALQLSFDGIAPAQAHRGADTFEVLDHLLDSLRTTHPHLFKHRLRVAVTVIPDAVRHVASSLDYLLRKGVRDIVVSPIFTPDPGWNIDGIDELDRQIAKISDLSLNHLEQTGEVPLRTFRKTRDKTDSGTNSFRQCNGLNGSSVVVDVDGSLCGCPLFVESGQDFPASRFLVKLRSLRMGNISQPGFYERRATVRRTVQRLRTARWRRQLFSSYGECRKCPYLADCHICPVSVWNNADDREAYRVPAFICAFRRTVLKYRERFPCMPDLFDSLHLGINGPDPIDPIAEYLRIKDGKHA